MWTKVFVLVAVTTLTGSARISGLQNDLGTGYSYNRPEESDAFTSVQSSVAYYINIPASEGPADYFYVSSNPGGGIAHYTTQSQDLTAPSGYGGGLRSHASFGREIPDDNRLRTSFSASPSTSGLSLHAGHDESYSREIPGVAHSGFSASPSTAGFNPFVPLPDVPRYSDYTPFAPSFSQNMYGASPRPQFISSPPRYQQQHLNPRSRPHHNPLPLPATNFQYQSPTFRSTQQQIFADVQQRRVPEHQHLSVPSQQLMPPRYSPHVTLQVAPKSTQYRVVPPMASLPMSLNVKLPFPIGVVPIKFRPLPLKTHLRQAGLLPITSYQATESYRK